MSLVSRKKVFAGALAALTVAGTLAVTTTEASARWRRGGWGWGPGLAAGAVGALAFGALARPYYYGYGYPGYYPGYYGYAGYAPGCFVERQRVWTPYGWRIRRVSVC